MPQIQARKNKFSVIENYSDTVNSFDTAVVVDKVFLKSELEKCVLCSKIKKDAFNEVIRTDSVFKLLNDELRIKQVIVDSLINAIQIKDSLTYEHQTALINFHVKHTDELLSEYDAQLYRLQTDSNLELNKVKSELIKEKKSRYNYAIISFLSGCITTLGLILLISK